MPFIDNSNTRAIGPFQIPGGDFGPQTNGTATPAMPGFITPPAPPKPPRPVHPWDGLNPQERRDYFQGLRGGMKYGSRNPLLL